MKVGLDLSVVQTPHRMRGIGATAINFVNNLSGDIKENHRFVFYLYKQEQEAALELFNLSGISYEIRTLKAEQRVSLKLPSKLHLVNTMFNNLRDIIMTHRGDTRIKDTSDLEAFLQFDPMQPLPRSKRFKKGLVIYDLIPYIMEADYLWSYSTARQHQNSRKSALRKAWLRRKYIKKVRVVSKQADILFAISARTKADYVSLARIKPSQIKVVHLGVNKLSTQQQTKTFHRYEETSWGYFPKKTSLGDKPFLLFLGGSDPRRKLIHLVAAYNNLKAQGHDIQLVLVGDVMKGPRAIPVTDVQEYLAESSYLDDILFLGFVSDAQREWLYEHAVAMVYPSVYEGFGLPVLEAMQHGTPVITYDNTSIREIAGDAALYAHDASSIKTHVEELLDNQSLRESHKKSGQKQAAMFDWSKTSKKILNSLLS